MIVSDFDPLGEIKVLDLIYDELKVSSIYKEYFNFFTKLCNDKKADPNRYMDLENSFSKFINSSPDKSKELKQKINRYFHILGLIEYVISFDKKYKEECFLDFFKRYSNIFNTINKADESIDEVAIYFDNKIGIVQLIDDKEIKPHKPPSSGEDSIGENKEYKYNILEIIEKRNEEEENIGNLIEEFKRLIDEFFEYVKNHKEFNDLKAKMNAIQFNESEVYRVFNIIYKSFIRRKKGNEWELFKKNTTDLVEKLCDDFEKEINKNVVINHHL